MWVGQVANHTEVLKQVVAEHYLKEKGAEAHVYTNTPCGIG